MKKLFLLVACLFAGALAALAQNSVKGTVTSASGDPVVGAYVMVSEHANIGAVTDENGAFSISNVPQSAKTLTASCIGMTTVSVKLSAGTIKIVMEEDNQFLDEVVITAQGLSRKEKSIGYSTVKVDGDKLSMSREGDLSQSLVGKVSGARFFSASGATFDEGTIILRGTSSFTDRVGSEPIYVVDGTITSKGAINMDDVASVNVLKGPAATALYGARGGNGAVIISTQSARAGEAHINFSHTIKFETFYNHFDLQDQYGGGSLGYNGALESTVSKYPGEDTMSAAFLYGKLRGWTNPDGTYYMDYGSDENWGARFDKNTMVASPLYYEESSKKYKKADPWVNYLDLGDLYRTGMSNITNISFTKGGKDHLTRVSFTNSERQGIVYNSGAVRRFLSVKEIFKPAKWLNLSMDYKFAYRQNHNASGEGYSAGRNMIGDFVQWGQANVNIADYKDYKRPDGSWTTWNVKSPTNKDAAFHNNPYAVYKEYNNYVTNIFNVITGDAEFLLPLNIKAGFKFMGSFRNAHEETKVPIVEHSYTWTSSYTERQYHTSDITAQGRITWGDTFINDRLGVDVAAFIEQREYDYGNLKGNTTNGLTINELYNLNASSGYVQAVNELQKYKTRSVFANATVGFDNTYFVDISVRNDWDSRLPDSANSYFYTGASASVMLNQFIKSAKWLDFWKLRASVAQVGSTLGVYKTKYIYDATSKYNSTPTLKESAVQLNQQIKPTISTSYEIGTEFKMFKNRFRGDINFYRRDSKNQILNVTVAPQSGFSSRQINAGLIRNQGIEIALAATPIKSKSVTWDVDFNISKNVNKLVRLNDEISSYFLGSSKFYYVFANEAKVGKPIGELYTESRWAKTDEGEYILDETAAGSWGGGYMPHFDKGIKKYVGNFQPKFIGGFSTNISYKNFSLGASFDYTIGGKIFSWTNMFGQECGTMKESSATNPNGVNIREPISKGGGVFVKGVTVTRNADGDITSKKPVECYMNAYQYFHQVGQYDNDRWLYDRSYLKMRELSLTYNVPKKALKKLGIGLNAASIAFVATNPWLIYSAIPNMDPSEASSNYIEGGQAPSTRSFGATVKLTF